jgi:hypothetical protein
MGASPSHRAYNGRMADTAPGPLEGGGIDTLDRELEELLSRELVEEGDHERFSHYAPKNKIMESALTGKPVLALCGKLWVPGRDPQKFPVCPTCKEIYEKLKE